MLDVHFWPTPNGKKVTILLEELGLDYKIVPCNIGRGDQFKADFLQINPNHRMPVLIDHAPKGGGAPISVFESGAIMMYLAEKEGRFFPQDTRGKYEVTQCPEAGDLTYAIRRFTDETNRLYGVMNNRLFDRRYLAGDEYTIADMISYPWTVGWEAQGQDINEFKHFKRWFEEVGNRAAVMRGMEAGNNLRVDPSTLTAEQRAQMRKIMYNQRAIPAPA